MIQKVVVSDWSNFFVLKFWGILIGGFLTFFAGVCWPDWVTLWWPDATLFTAAAYFWCLLLLIFSVFCCYLSLLQFAVICWYLHEYLCTTVAIYCWHYFYFAAAILLLIFCYYYFAAATATTLLLLQCWCCYFVTAILLRFGRFGLARLCRFSLEWFGWVISVWCDSVVWFDMSRFGYLGWRGSVGLVWCGSIDLVWCGSVGLVGVVRLVWFGVVRLVWFGVVWLVWLTWFDWFGWRG